MRLTIVVRVPDIAHVRPDDIFVEHPRSGAHLILPLIGAAGGLAHFRWTDRGAILNTHIIQEQTGVVLELAHDGFLIRGVNRRKHGI